MLLYLEMVECTKILTTAVHVLRVVLFKDDFKIEFIFVYTFNLQIDKVIG